MLKKVKIYTIRECSFFTSYCKPYYIVIFPGLPDSNHTTLQPETKALMNWMLNHNFILSVSLQSGSLVVGYPYAQKNIGQYIHRSVGYPYAQKNIGL